MAACTLGRISHWSALASPIKTNAAVLLSVLQTKWANLDSNSSVCMHNQSINTKLAYVNNG